MQFHSQTCLVFVKLLQLCAAQSLGEVLFHESHQKEKNMVHLELNILSTVFPIRENF